MTAPSFTLNTIKPTTLMGTVNVGVHVNMDTLTTGDDTPKHKAVFWWYLTARTGSSLDSIPDRHRYALDRRLGTAAGIVNLAGRVVNTLVDLLGAASGRARTLITGFSHSYVLTPGDWTVHCVAMNEGGETTEVTEDISVSSAAYTTNTLATSGGDHDNLEDAFSWINGGDARKLIIDNDFDGTADTFLQLQRNNLLVTTTDPDSATKPKIRHNATTGNTTRLLEALQGFECIIVEGLEFKGSTRSAANNTMAWRFRGDNCALIGCSCPDDPDSESAYFPKSFYFDTNSQAINANLLLNCDSKGSGGGTGNYTIATAGTNTDTMSHVYGGDYEESANESIYRTTTSNAAQYPKNLLGYYNNTESSSKSCIRYTKVDWGDIVDVYCIDGDLWIGSATGAQSTLQVNGVAVRGGWFIGVSSIGSNVSVKDAAQNVVFLNCRIGAAGIAMGTGTQGADHNANDNISVINCTIEGILNSGGRSDAGSTTGCEIIGCIINGDIDIVASLFTANGVKDNVLGGSVQLDGVNEEDPATLNASSIGLNNVAGPVTLGDNLYPSTDETVTRVGANQSDMWGYSRAATTQVGAVGALVEDPGESSGGSGSGGGSSSSGRGRRGRARARRYRRIT
jgi:hypothetical protein